MKVKLGTERRNCWVAVGISLLNQCDGTLLHKNWINACFKLEQLGIPQGFKNIESDVQPAQNIKAVIWNMCFQDPFVAFEKSDPQARATLMKAAFALFDLIAKDGGGTWEVLTNLAK